MPINGSELLDAPFDTIFSPFTDVLGSAFWLIPLTFITVALYIKTQNAVTTGMFMIATGSLLSAGTMFAGFPEMGLAYLIFAVLGIIGVIAGIFFRPER